MSTRRVLPVLILASLVAVAGCGRKAGLDTPFEAAVNARKEAARNKEPLPPEPTPPVEDKPFVLDGLLE